VYKLDKVGYFWRVVTNDPGELLRVARIVWTTAKFRYLKRCVGPGSVIGGATQIINSGNVSIGRKCLLQDAVYIRAGTEGRVLIGDRAAINSFCRFFGHGGIEIGEDTQIGPGTLITTTTHDFSRELEAAFEKVVIGRRVWIGANVTILPGVEIGDFAVIGAGSVVNRSIPAGSLAVGVPARVVRKVEPPDPEAPQAT